MNKYENLIKLLKDFIYEGENGINQSKAIESAIDAIYDETDSFMDNFLDELSHYSPAGGDHLINYQSFMPKAKKALEYFEALSNNSSQTCKDA